MVHTWQPDMRVTLTLEVRDLAPEEMLIVRVSENLQRYAKALRNEAFGGKVVSRPKTPLRLFGKDTIMVEVKE